jgi:hypothetical protein
MAKRNLDFELNKKKYTALTIKWCKQNFGVNERKRTKLKIEVTNRIRVIKKSMVYGNYCFYRNKMTIHIDACKTIFDLVSTVIHEYTHYLQSRNLYKQYEETHTYFTNPCEREARRNEKRYTKYCIKEIKKYL